VRRAREGTRRAGTTARGWWERLGFHPFDPDDKQHPDLYLLAAEIEKTLGGRR
jgi:hypothetical protein